MILHIKIVCPKCNGNSDAYSTNCCIKCLGKGEVEIWISDVIEYEEEKDK